MPQGNRSDLRHSANLQKVAPTSVADAASLFNVSERSIHHARTVLGSGDGRHPQNLEHGANPSPPLL
jgi:hypothetical protein